MVYMYHVSYTILLLYSVLFTSRHGPMVICHLGSSYCLHMTFIIALKAFYHNFIMLQIYNRINYRIAIIKCNLEPHYQVWRIAFIMSNTQPDKLTSSIAIYKQSNNPSITCNYFRPHACQRIWETITYSFMTHYQYIIIGVIVLSCRDTYYHQ